MFVPKKKYVRASPLLVYKFRLIWSLNIDLTEKVVGNDERAGESANDDSDDKYSVKIGRNLCWI